MHRLFFAIRPDERAASAAVEEGARLRAAHRLAVNGRPLSADRLHITLHWLRDHEVLPEDLVAAAMAAGRDVDATPFGVVLDRAGTLPGARGGGPLVLMSAERQLALRRFQRDLGVSMAGVGIGPLVRRSFKPHMTLLYADQTVVAQRIDPIRWTVDELVLIHSVIGESRHVVLGRWALPDRQRRLGDW